MGCYSGNMNEAMTPKRILTYVLFVLVLIAGAVMIYGVIMYPTKQPYRDAKAAYQTVYNDNVAFTQSGMAINASTATEAAFKTSLATTRTALETLKTDTKKLGEQGVLKDGEGKAKYEAFSKSLEGYATYNTAILTSIEVLRPALLECTNAMASTSGSERAVAALRDCSSKLQSLAAENKVPSADYRAMAVSFAGIYNNLADATSDSVREDLVSELSLASNTFAKDLSASRAAVDITPSAKALDDYLGSKTRLFF